MTDVNKCDICCMCLAEQFLVLFSFWIDLPFWSFGIIFSSTLTTTTREKRMKNNNVCSLLPVRYNFVGNSHSYDLQTLATSSKSRFSDLWHSMPPFITTTYAQEHENRTIVSSVLLLSLFLLRNGYNKLGLVICDIIVSLYLIDHKSIICLTIAQSPSKSEMRMTFFFFTSLNRWQSEREMRRNKKPLFTSDSNNLWTEKKEPHTIAHAHTSRNKSVALNSPNFHYSFFFFRCFAFFRVVTL